jgi:hypothetical protein
MRSVLFWALILAGVLYVVRTYLRDHPELAHLITGWRPFAALRNLWAAVRRWFLRWRTAVRQAIPRRIARRPAAGKAARRPFRFLRLGALSPRERILYYYWSILRRAERLGFPRRPPETPYEYDASMRPHLPQAELEMGELTEAFLEARYSQRSIEAGRDRQVRPAWRGVRGALRALRKKRAADNEPDK